MFFAKESLEIKKASSGLLTIPLHHGVSIAMLSDGTSDTTSFQRQYQHCVPKRKKTKGTRFNVTFRSTVKNPNRNYNLVLAQATKRYTLDEHCTIALWDSSFIGGRLVANSIYRELAHVNMHADKTYVYGKWHDNNGRKVIEMGHEKGMTYSYGGKTTRPGIPFTPLLKKLVKQKIAPLFEEPVENIWAHIVSYPPEASLGWHSDAEEGIDPHFIMSVTFLEYPVEGVRDFQVRKK